MRKVLNPGCDFCSTRGETTPSDYRHQETHQRQRDWDELKYTQYHVLIKEATLILEVQTVICLIRHSLTFLRVKTHSTHKMLGEFYSVSSLKED